MRTRVGCYAWIERDGKVLLTHFRKGNASGWTLPGGGMEIGEQPDDTIVREVREEVGYDVALGELLGINSVYRTDSEVADFGVLPPPDSGETTWHSLRIVRRASVTGGTFALETAGSTTDARWVDLDALADLDGLVALVHTARAWVTHGS